MALSQSRMKLHALVDDLDTARAAIHGGATVLQLRIKGASTEELVRIGVTSCLWLRATMSRSS